MLTFSPLAEQDQRPKIKGRCKDNEDSKIFVVHCLTKQSVHDMTRGSLSLHTHGGSGGDGGGRRGGGGGSGGPDVGHSASAGHHRGTIQ